MELSRVDSGTTRTAHVRDRIIVRLPERPTTGYRWQVDVDPDALRQIDDAFEGATVPAGAPGLRVLTFEALRAGGTTLRLVERRSWEQTTTDEFVVELDVQPT